MEKLSERLNELSQRAKHTEDTIDAALARNRERLQQQRKALSADVETGRENFAAQTAEARTEVESKWHELRRALEDQFAAMRTEAVERHARRDEKRAERRAEDAEVDAVIAVEFAEYALEQAEYAIVEAAHPPRGRRPRPAELT